MINGKSDLECYSEAEYDDSWSDLVDFINEDDNNIEYDLYSSDKKPEFDNNYQDLSGTVE